LAIAERFCGMPTRVPQLGELETALTFPTSSVDLMAKK
jgi:hypothetical protein